MLRLLGPEQTLERGYSITRDSEGKVIRSVRIVRPKMKIRTRVSDGEFESAVATSYTTMSPINPAARGEAASG
jgi:exonuclease VII large subunit